MVCMVSCLSLFVRSVLKLDKAEDTVRMKCHTTNKWSNGNKLVVGWLGRFLVRTYHVDAQEHCIYPQLMTVQASPHHWTTHHRIFYNYSNVTQWRDSIMAKSKETGWGLSLKTVKYTIPLQGSFSIIQVWRKVLSWLAALKASRVAAIFWRFRCRSALCHHIYIVSISNS